MKMSKSRGNVIAPDEYVHDLGADVVRLYLMFMGPWEGGGDWSDSGINGVARWVNRLWDLCLRDTGALPEADAASDRAVVRKTHQTIRAVIEGLERFKYNTAIAAMMELTNEMSPAYDAGTVSRAAWSEAVESLLLLLARWARTSPRSSGNAPATPTASTPGPCRSGTRPWPPSRRRRSSCR